MLKYCRSTNHTYGRTDEANILNKVGRIFRNPGFPKFHILITDLGSNRHAILMEDLSPFAKTIKHVPDGLSGEKLLTVIDRLAEF